MTVPDDCSGWLFRMSIPDDCFRWLFGMTIPDDCSRWVFRMTIPDAYFRWLWLFRMTIPDAYFKWLFRMAIPDTYFRWLFRVTVRDPTTDSYISDQFVFPRPIPISANHSTDWSHDWFIFERRLPTADYDPDPPDKNLSKKICCE